MTITLATLPKATAQEVFDHVARHLLTQNRKSMRKDYNGCAYRGKGGTSCAAGCLIADDEYYAKMEGGSWGGLVQRHMVPTNHAVLISRLQIVHDASLPEEWRERLAGVAACMALGTEVLK